LFRKKAKIVMWQRKYWNRTKRLVGEIVIGFLNSQLHDQVPIYRLASPPN
jgi:hypothetical protein